MHPRPCGRQIIQNFLQQLYDQGIRFGCWGMALYALTCAFYSMIIEKLIKKFTAKRVFVCGMLDFSLGMAILGENLKIILVNSFHPKAFIRSTLPNQSRCLNLLSHCGDRLRDAFHHTFLAGRPIPQQGNVQNQETREQQRTGKSRRPDCRVRTGSRHRLRNRGIHDVCCTVHHVTQHRPADIADGNRRSRPLRCEFLQLPGSHQRLLRHLHGSLR